MRMKMRNVGPLYMNARITAPTLSRANTNTELYPSLPRLSDQSVAKPDKLWSLQLQMHTSIISTLPTPFSTSRYLSPSNRSVFFTLSCILFILFFCTYPAFSFEAMHFVFVQILNSRLHLANSSNSPPTNLQPNHVLVHNQRLLCISSFTIMNLHH